MLTSATTTHAYDLNGSRTNKTVVGGSGFGTTTYLYDTANRLVAAQDTDSNTIFTATYDYRTRRVSVTEGLAPSGPKLFHYDSGDSFQELSNATLSVEFVRGSGLGGIARSCR